MSLYMEPDRYLDEGHTHPQVISPPRPNPLDVQVGGGHYKSMKFQPLEYIMANGMNFCEGSVIKYVSRWHSKGGVEDLKKARHYLDILIKENE